MKVTRSNDVKVRELLAWTQRYQPHVYRGLVRRFTAPAQQQLAGFWDSVGTVAGNVATSASNFVQSQGGLDKLLTAAQPFIKNELEKRQLQLQIKRVNAGLPATDPATGTPLPTRPPAPAPGAPQETVTVTAKPFHWGWAAGGVAALVALLAFMPRSSRRA